MSRRADTRRGQHWSRDRVPWNLIPHRSPRTRKPTIKIADLMSRIMTSRRRRTTSIEIRLMITRRTRRSGGGLFFFCYRPRFNAPSRVSQRSRRRRRTPPARTDHSRFKFADANSSSNTSGGNRMARGGSRRYEIRDPCSARDYGRHLIENVPNAGPWAVRRDAWLASRTPLGLEGVCRRGAGLRARA